MEDETMHFTKKGTKRSTLFNVSVRGWIAFLLVFTLCANLSACVFSSFFGVTISAGLETALISLFSAATGAAVNEYFRQFLKEGQKT